MIKLHWHTLLTVANHHPDVIVQDQGDDPRRGIGVASRSGKWEVPESFVPSSPWRTMDVSFSPTLRSRQVPGSCARGACGIPARQPARRLAAEVVIRIRRRGNRAELIRPWSGCSSCESLGCSITPCCAGGIWPTRDQPEATRWLGGVMCFAPHAADASPAGNSRNRKTMLVPPLRMIISEEGGLAMSRPSPGRGSARKRASHGRRRSRDRGPHNRAASGCHGAPRR